MKNRIRLTIVTLIKLSIITLMCMMFITTSSQAKSMHDMMKDAYDNVSNHMNITKGGVYQSQAAGTMVSGGSISLRTPVENLQLLQVQAPSIKAGCNGIDLYMGGFQFPSSQKFIKFGKAVAQNALGYSFKLALEAVSPEISHVMETMQSWANKINNMDFNSCEAAEAIVDSAVNYASKGFHSACASSKLADGSAGSQEEAKDQCSADAKGDKSTGMPKVNLTFKALHDANLTDIDLLNSMQTLVGTIISDGLAFHVYEGFGGDQDWLKVFAGIGDKQAPLTYKGYICDNSVDCLKPTTSIITTQYKDTLYYRVNSGLESAMNSAMTGDALTDEKNAKMVVQGTTLPVVKYLQVQSLKPDAKLTINPNLAKLITMEMLTSYVTKTIRSVEQTVSKFSGSSAGEKLDLTSIEKYLNRLKVMKNNLLAIRRDMKQAYTEEMQFDETVMALEKQATGLLTNSLVAVLQQENQ